MAKSSRVTDKSIKDTGERMVPAYSQGKIVYGEHMVRYQSILPLVKNKVVLDIASGSGYGSAHLSRTAKHVYGVDISREAIQYAQKNYGSKLIDFMVGDGVKIPLKDNSVDVVVTFETIEHIEKYDQFMKEVKRVLKDKGLLILSTPNDKEYTEENHFHIHEFEQKELESFARQYFKHTEMYFQADWVTSAILEGNKLNEEWVQDVETHQLAPIKLDKSIYFMVIASDGPISGKVTELAVLSEHWSARVNRDSELIFKDHMDKQAEIIKHFKNEAEHEKEVTAALKGEKAMLEKELIALKQTLAVRLTQKSKHIKRRLLKH